MGKKYIKLTTKELIEYMRNFHWTRVLTQLHVHHTYLPDHSQFNGSNYDDVNWGMEYYHVTEAKFATIAQQVTLFPDGMWLIGRDFNMTPASILGWNTGSFCVEQVGNFDSGHDPYKSPQADAMYELSAFMIETYGLQMKFHRDSPTAYKTCPGSGIDRATFFNNVANYNKNKKIEELKKIMEQIKTVFTDMLNPDGTPHFSNDMVTYLANKKIVKGTANGDGTYSFHPNAPITRGEVAVLLAKAMESIEETIHTTIQAYSGK